MSRPRPTVSRSKIMGVLAGTSTRTPTSSSGTTPRAYRAARHHSRRSEPRRSELELLVHCGAQEGAAELGSEGVQLVELASRLGAGLRVALAQQRHDQLLVQAD